MKKLDRTQVAALMLLAVFLALGIGLGAAIARLPAESGDVLSLAGALLGAALTVGGAIYLIEHQRYQESNAAKEVLRELLEDVRQGIIDARQATRIPGTQEEYIPAIATMTHLDRLRERIETVQRATGWFTPTSAAMVRSFVQIGLMSIDVEGVRESVRPAVFYGGVPNIDEHVRMLECRVGIALTALDL